MSENEGRRLAVSVRRGDLRVGDIMNYESIYAGEDETQGAVCEGITRNRALVTVNWRIPATGEAFTDSRFENDRVELMRRGPSVPAREQLWDRMRLYMHSVSREEFEEHMDAYDQALRRDEGATS